MDIYRHDSDHSVGLPSRAPAPDKRLEPQLPLAHSHYNGKSETSERNLLQHRTVYGHSSTSTRHQLNSVYNFPPPPPPPALPSRPLVEHVETNGYSHSKISSNRREPLRKTSLVQRLGTVIPRRLSRQQGYGVLAEEDGVQQDMHRNNFTNREDHINIDLSGFEGPIALNDLSAGKGSDINGLGKSTGMTWTTQYEKPGSSRISRLGEGMGTIRRAPVEAFPSFEGTEPQIDSYMNFRARNEVQKVAERSGEIIMLEGMSSLPSQPQIQTPFFF